MDIPYVTNSLKTGKTNEEMYAQVTAHLEKIGWKYHAKRLPDGSISLVADVRFTRNRGIKNETKNTRIKKSD